MEKGCVAQVMDGVTVASGEVRYDGGERQLVAIAVMSGRVLVTMLVRAGFSAG